MEPLVIRDGLTIPANHLSVSFTRTLGGEDAATAARKIASTVELRFDTRGCPGLGPVELRKITAWRALRADRRGTVRVVCGDFRSRARNLEGARELLKRVINDALDSPLEPERPARRKRGRVGLIKGTPTE
ncbi:MAG: hypothetical protein CSA66_00945 [Proteobacteria bacterium]|nr:MAG: hypothetical protein CSA66_00945 [Pseudomonadota bacterium]